MTDQGKTPQGLDKVSRYKWKPLDKPGRFEWLPKHKLIVPTETYQRKGTNSKEVRIASNFSWAAFQTISVAGRCDGLYNVIEGGHRLRAAMKRDDVLNVPCMIFDISDEKDQAKAFLSVNKERKPMSGIDRHKAMIIAGDPVAAKVENAVNAIGRTVGKSGQSAREVSCINEMRRCIETDEQAFNRVWPVIAEVCEGRRITRDIVIGIFRLERFVDGGVSSGVRASRVISVGYDALIEGSRQGREFHGHPGETAIADGMLKKINKGLRNKWELE